MVLKEIPSTQTLSHTLNAVRVTSSHAGQGTGKETTGPHGHFLSPIFLKNHLIMKVVPPAGGPSGSGPTPSMGTASDGSSEGNEE